MGAKRVSKQGVTVSTGNAIEVTNTSDAVLFSVDNTGAIGRIANLTAKGSILTASATSTPAALAVGANGETLVADSSTSTGLRYTAGTVQDNPVLNSSFQLWQRGTSIAQTAAIMYGADRWCSNRGGLDTGSTISRQVTGDTTNLPNIQYCARVQRDNANASTNIIYFSQTIESINSIPYAGKTITFSFYARKGANYSSASDALSVNVVSATGTDQNALSTWTGGAFVVTQTATLTSTWQRFTYTGTVSSSATQLGFYFNYTPVGTAGAADYFEVTGVQIDVGSVALPFRTYAGTIQGELAACKRYLPSYRGQFNQIWGAGYSTTGAQYTLPFDVEARVKPTGMTISAAGDFTIINTGFGSGAATSVTFNQAGVNSATINSAHTAGTPTIAQNQPVAIQFSGANAVILFTGCEL